MNDIPRTSEAAGTPSNNWEETATRLFDCSAKLEREHTRMRWLLRQIASDLPQNRDWLKPEYEQEMRAWAGQEAAASPAGT